MSCKGACIQASTGCKLGAQGAKMLVVQSPKPRELGLPCHAA